MRQTLHRESVTTTHEHGWITLSRHATSEGVIVYTRCVDCPAHRVELAGQTRSVVSATL